MTTTQTDNGLRSTLATMPDGNRCLCITNGNKLLFRGASASPPAGNVFAITNWLRRDEMGKPALCPDGRPMCNAEGDRLTVGGYGGTVTVTIAEDETYSVAGETEG